MKKQTGFNLIELMIVVVIIGVISSIAIPAYNDYIAKARRAQAQGALLELASAMERFFAENNTYCGSDNGGTVGTCVVNDSPGIFSDQVPVDTGVAYYNLTIGLTIKDGKSTEFTLVATRTGSMSNDKCGNFTLSNVGQKGLTSNTSTDCWK